MLNFRGRQLLEDKPVAHDPQKDLVQPDRGSSKRNHRASKVSLQLMRFRPLLYIMTILPQFRSGTIVPSRMAILASGCIGAGGRSYSLEA
jgi:hypothetical protein